MIARFRYPAPVGTRFAPDAFDRTLGDVVTMRGLDVDVDGEVVAVEVVDDGRAVLIDLDLPELEAQP